MTILSPTQYGVELPKPSKDKMQPLFTQPPMNTTFFFDTDAEDSDSEPGELLDDVSPIDSVESLARLPESTTPASSVETVEPAADKEEHSPNLMFRLKSVKGHSDAHVFRATLASTQDFNWETYQPDEPQEPVPEIPATIKNSFESQLPPATVVDDDLVADFANECAIGDDGDVRGWSTQQVGLWMYNSGFENAVISKFRLHDINGAILTELKFEDLRELDITSFAKRRQIWNEISALRTESSDGVIRASITKADRSCSQGDSGDEKERTKRPGFDRGVLRGRGRRKVSSSVAGDAQGSVSPVGTLDIPKPHRCSKGEKCPKFARQQRLLEEVDQDRGPSTPPSETAPLFHSRMPSAETLGLRPESQVMPTFTVPSSVPTGDQSEQSDEKPDEKTEGEKQEEKSEASKTENFDQYLSLQQSVERAQASPGSPSSTYADTPRLDSFPDLPRHSSKPSFPPRQSSLGGPALPKLSIPSSPTHSAASSLSTVREAPSTAMEDSPARPVTPPPAERAMSPEPLFQGRSPAPMARGFSPAPSFRGYSPTPASRNMSPTPSSGRATPVSQMGPRSPVQHSRSSASESSVGVAKPLPLFVKQDPVSSTLPNSTFQPRALRSSASTDNLPRRRNVTPLPTLTETATASPKASGRISSALLLSKPLPKSPTPTIPPSDGPEDTTAASTPTTANTTSPIAATPKTPRTPATPSARTSSIKLGPNRVNHPPQAYGPDTIRAGWVRRRRARLWRHEWAPAHVRLTGTTLAIFETARPDDDKPVEVIDIDDFVVDCNVDNGSKLAAAVRKNFRMGGSRSSAQSIGLEGEGIFPWQLIPASGNGERAAAKTVAPASDEAAVVKEDGQEKLQRTYYFSVRSRDERIEWMRGVMVAKALKQKGNVKKAEEQGATPRTRAGSF